MRRIIVCFFILTGLYTAHAQKSTPAPAPVVTRYMYFTGTIDKYPVSFHLYQVKNEISGCYYYNSTEEPIFIAGKIDDSHFLKLTNYSEKAKEKENIEGVFKDSAFSGTWSSNGKVLPFRITQKKDNSGLSFDYIWTSGSKKLVKKHDYGPEDLEYDAASVWPSATSSHPAVPLIKQVIRKTFDEEKCQDEIGQIFIRQKKQLLNAEKAGDEIETYTSGTTMRIEYRNDQLLVLHSEGYVDNGGAHPNSFTYYTCIDLIHQRKMHITDVLDTLAGQKSLHQLLEKKFRAAYNLGNDEKLSDYLFQNSIPPNDNFLLTTKGIAFQYNAYEIGAYAIGPIYLYIPFKEINAYLKPEFKQLIGTL